MKDIITEKIGTGFNNIRIIKNFMDEKTINDLLLFCNNNKKIDNNEEFYGFREMPSEIIEILIRYKQKVIENVTAYYKDICSIKEYKPFENRGLMLLAHPNGSHMNPHVDIVGYNQNVDGDVEDYLDKWTGHLACLIYLNDDYDGGELSFPEWGVSIKPKPGMLITFPGNKHYIHEVKKVVGSTRFTVSSWIRFNDAIGQEMYSLGAEK